MGLGLPANLRPDALVFLKRWKDSLSHHRAFEALSEQMADILTIQRDLEDRDYNSLLEMDVFRPIDQKILSGLAHSVAERTISAEGCAAVVRRRRRSHWFAEFEHFYSTIDYASQFLAALDASRLAVHTLADGIQGYLQSWHGLDQLYRKVIFHARKSGQVTLLERLVGLVENLYTNNYLLKLNDNWQGAVDGCSRWEGGPIALQRDFYTRWILPFVQNRKKVYVIISDALRYEVGEELLGRVRHEDRYDAQLEAMLSMLPSYTQLGMAALLPNQALEISDPGTAAVSADGLSTQGTPNRDKILKHALDGKGAAVRAEDVLSMNRDACRDLVRDNDVVYVYHNRIDATGDKKESEDRVFEEVEDTLEELVTLVKKLTSANATNLIVTSDHGFLYQNRPLDESEFAGAEVHGREVVYLHRRFALGHGLSANSSLKKFTAAELGLAGDLEVQIPKSINRLRLKGSGSRYVHGGASLQEVILPVLLINKKRETDVKQVEVEILRGTNAIITTGQLSVAFYQSEPVTDKVQPRKLRAGLYTRDNKLISDLHELLFDLQAENPRQREVQVRFVLTQEADQANNQEVVLRLEEQVPGTSHYKEYATTLYTLRRSFTSDFDF